VPEEAGTDQGIFDVCYQNIPMYDSLLDSLSHDYRLLTFGEPTRARMVGDCHQKIFACERARLRTWMKQSQ
jgi:hypothetical protein